jgi:hypothetical protein
MIADIAAFDHVAEWKRHYFATTAFTQANAIIADAAAGGPSTTYIEVRLKITSYPPFNSL